MPFIQKKIVVLFLLSIVILSFFSSLAFSSEVFYYKTYDPQTQKTLNRFHYSLQRMPSGDYEGQWTFVDEGIVTEKYILGKDFETLSWSVKDPKKQTDYVGERKGDVLIIKGRFEGGEVDKEIQIDNRFFFYNPKIGLQKFVISGMKSEKFWGFNQRDLKAYPMKAIRKDNELIRAGGQKMKAVRVYWTVDDFRSAFFKRVYWFRAADGLYLKQKSEGGTFREFVKEEIQ